MGKGERKGWTFLWHYKNKDTFVLICAEEAGEREREHSTTCFGERGGVGLPFHELDN